MPSHAVGSSGGVAVVAGGGRGVGPDVVRALADLGFAVAIHCHASLRQARDLAAAVEAAGGRALAVTADLREEGAVRALVHRVADRFGRIDAVVAAARLRRPGRFEELTAADLAAHFEVNVTGTLVLAQEAAAVMERQDEGGVVVAVAAAAAARPDETAFSASQAAIPALMRSLAAAFASRHPRLRANCLISPHPAADPREVAAAAVALVDAASPNGTVLRMGPPA